MYLPFKAESGHPKMGLKPLPLESWLEIDEYFSSQLALKSKLLSHCSQDVFVALPDTQLAQQESLQLIVDYLLEHFPAIYRAESDGRDRLHNWRTQQTWQLSGTTIAPLDLAARLVQEDLCLMQPAQLSTESPADLSIDNGYRLAAASVCFPLRWSLCEKVGQSMGKIHQRVPEYSQRLTRPVDNMFNRLREDAPGLRFNWTVVDSPELRLLQDKQVTAFNSAVTAENAGEMLWLRVERQTLRRLPVSRSILFTIRTFIYPLSQVVQQPGAAGDLATAIEALKPELQVYKNLLPFRQALMSYLACCVERRLSAEATC